MEPIKVTYNSIQDIDPEKRFLIDELTIVGKFVLRSDLVILRSMCNAIIDGKRTGGNLSVLDLSRCTIDWEHYKLIFADFDLRDCISLKKIFLPFISRSPEYHPDLDMLSGYYFSGCKSLESIEVAPKTGNIWDYYYDDDGVLFVKKNTKIVKYPANKGNEYTIPNDVSEIGGCAFEDSHLTKLTMPTVPPTCNEDAFKGVNRAAMTLVVPKGTFNSYWMHPVYGKFKIVEMDE